MGPIDFNLNIRKKIHRFKGSMQKIGSRFEAKDAILAARILTIVSVVALVIFTQHDKPAPPPKAISLVANPKSEELRPAGIITEEVPTPEQKPEEEKVISAPEEPAKAEEKVEEKPAPPKSDLTIGIIADAHAGQANGFSRLSAITWSLDHYFDPEIAIDLGDLIESRSGGKRIGKDAALADFKRASSLISRYFPVFHVIGNHEVLSMGKKNIESACGRPNSYSFVRNGYNVIILDTNYKSDGDNIDAKNGNKSIYDGTITESRLDWLERQLENNARNIIFSHHPLREINNSGAVEKIIRKNSDRVILTANGHQHPTGVRASIFGGARSYDIPSALYQRSYAVILLNGKKATVLSRVGSK